ncbi:DUF397 domain-containing protein [Actinokineospora diospyrosa]|uniref:DUF397 domain-containing protein n=1 Tax=Actinokineospora diospyrosa TaxID=103728 RepID=A0ABT1IHB5_9PSEU|nr:DUF397 domain-containing protein [Actinokineospora diospyrosa]MCP2272027.1 protein of unknown function (DUF397) [Actinokineospora diospyrosa]
MQNPTWRKSTRSSNGSNCVEVRSDLSAVRDSKNPGGPALPVDIQSLVRHLKG